MWRDKKEQGAIVVEASMALPIYMFLIITILTFINICYVQSKVQIAVNTSAKQMSEYMHIYYASGANTLLGSGGGTSSAAMGKLSGYMSDVLDIFGIENEFLDGFTEALGNTSIAGIVEGEVAKGIARGLIETELITSEDESVSDFYERLRIENEDFAATVQESDGAKILAIGMSYDVKVIELFDIDIKFHFFNAAETQIWDAYTEGAASE